MAPSKTAKRWKDEEEEDALSTEEEMRNTPDVLWNSKAFSLMEISVDPKEIPLCYETRLFRHLVINESPFPVVCRLLSSSPPGFLVLKENPRFIVEANGCYSLSVKKADGWGRGRTEILLLQVLPVDKHFQQMPMWELKAQQLFNLGRKPVSLTVRYTRLPPYVQGTFQLFKPLYNTGGIPLFGTDHMDISEVNVLDAVVAAKERVKPKEEIKKPAGK